MHTAENTRNIPTVSKMAANLYGSFNIASFITAFEKFLGVCFCKSV